MLAWGYKAERVFKLQRKAVRVMSLSKSNAYADPIFRKLNILKMEDILEMQQLKFYYKLRNNRLPDYFMTFDLSTLMYIHMKPGGISKWLPFF